MQPRTQKAKGLVAIANYAESLNFGNYKHSSSQCVTPLPFTLIGEESDLDQPTFYIKEELFARPCPVTPQHGFVDSRPVKTKDEARKVFRLARKADPKAEMLLMPFIKAEMNAIFTPGLLAIGPGNDGATSGNASVQLRVTGNLPFTNDEIVKASGIGASSPYLEFVTDRKDGQNRTFLVQLRGGPKAPTAGPDFCPFDFKVTAVVKAKGDLMEWQAACAKFKAGTVVYHPGGNLADHYTIHCIDHDIPIFTSGRLPKVGELIKKIPYKKPELDPEEVMLGLAHAVTFSVDYEHATMLVLGALHNRLSFGKPESRLFGVGVMLALKLGLAACFGEVRHYRHQKSNLDRDQIYHQAWADVANHVKRFNDARKKFYEKGAWGSQFGGKAWGKCADSLADLWNAMVRFVRTRSKENLLAVSDALNVMINQAHNNGWWFNKFINPQWFDVAVQSPATPLIVAMREVYEIMTAKPQLAGLLADIERTNAEEGATTRHSESASGRKVVNKPTEGTTYGQFKIVYVPSGKPWFVYSQTGEKLGRCAGLWGVAKMYLESHDMPVTDEKRKEVMKHIESVLGKTPATGKYQDTWLIPDIGKPAPSADEKITAAACIFRGNVLHVQMTKADGGYDKTDVAVAQEVAAAIKKISKKVPSLSGSNNEYTPLQVKSDGVFAGPHKIVALKNQCF